MFGCFYLVVIMSIMNFKVCIASSLTGKHNALHSNVYCHISSIRDLCTLLLPISNVVPKWNYFLCSKHI